MIGKIKCFGLVANFWGKGKTGFHDGENVRGFGFPCPSRRIRDKDGRKAAEIERRRKE